MQILIATLAHIPQIQIVRNAVTENTLSNPNLVPDSDVADYITNRGRGWVAVINNQVVGFAIADLISNNVWAIFIHPTHHKKGIGKQLHHTMLNWYFNNTNTTIWLGTTPNTRAEAFYRKAGWVAVGMHGGNEIKFEMTKSNWVVNCKL